MALRELGAEGRVGVEVQVPQVDRDGDGDAHGDGQEDQALLAEVHAVTSGFGWCWETHAVDDGEALEERVEDAVDEADVD